MKLLTLKFLRGFFFYRVSRSEWSNYKSRPKLQVEVHPKMTDKV
jgi:hypothetical protein